MAEGLAHHPRDIQHANRKQLSAIWICTPPRSRVHLVATTKATALSQIKEALGCAVASLIAVWLALVVRTANKQILATLDYVVSTCELLLERIE